jgi:hypothetical protein
MLTAVKYEVDDFFWVSSAQCEIARGYHDIG